MTGGENIVQSSGSIMQCGCFRWPVAASTSFYNSVAGPVVAKAGTLTIKMPKIPIVGVAPLATRSYSNRITFLFSFGKSNL